MPIRTRRLTRDYERILSDLAGSEFVTVRVLGGDPPNHYEVTYRVNGLKWDEQVGGAVPVDTHVVDIFLPVGYPRMAPRCTMRTPIWHPNIGDYVCIGDFWSAGVALVDIIAHIGDMIQYKTYNLKSPVNRDASNWALTNLRSFPIGTRQILPPASEDVEPDISIHLPPPCDELDIDLGPLRDRRC